MPKKGRYKLSGAGKRAIRKTAAVSAAFFLLCACKGGGRTPENPSAKAKASPQPTRLDEKQTAQTEQAPPAESGAPAPGTPARETEWRFETPLLDKGKARMKNIRLSVKKVNGQVLAPGQEFSFNETVGPRTAQLGYRKAYIFVEGEKVEEVGGGICQVASTIYNAALAAGLEITERHAHPEPVEYARDGTDATVYYGKLDFRFKNTRDFAIKLRCAVTRTGVSVTLSKTTENDKK